MTAECRKYGLLQYVRVQDAGGVTAASASKCAIVEYARQDPEAPARAIAGLKGMRILGRPVGAAACGASSCGRVCHYVLIFI